MIHAKAAKTLPRSKRLALGQKTLTKPLIQLSTIYQSINTSHNISVHPSEKIMEKHPTTRSWFPTCFWHGDSPMDNHVEHIDDTCTGLEDCHRSIPQNSTKLCQTFPLVTINFDSLIMTDLQIISNIFKQHLHIQRRKTKRQRTDGHVPAALTCSKREETLMYLCTI